MRVVQLSDLHLRAGGLPPQAEAVRAWIRADPPDLVVLTGDIVFEDPDNVDDRRAARDFVDALGCPAVAIPGNHDVGFFDEPDRRSERVAAFSAAWGADRFRVDGGGWRLVGIDTYTIGEPDADDWTAAALGADHPIALFVHQPVSDEPIDGWEAPPAVADRLGELLADHDVRLVASGHRHCAVVRERPGGPAAGEAVHVWAPSMTLTGLHRYHGGDSSPGVVDYVFQPGGVFSYRFVYPTA